MAHEHRFKLAYRHDAYQCRFSNEIVVAAMKRLGGDRRDRNWTRAAAQAAPLRPAPPSLTDLLY